MKLSELTWARLLLVMSGAAALGWQFIWTTQWTLLLGHEVYALLSVAASFLGGLCLGTWFMAKPMMQRAHLLRAYVWAEVIIAVWAGLLVMALPTLGPSVAAWLGETPSPVYQAVLAFALPTVVLLPCTFAMGVTLPAMLGVLKFQAIELPSLYAANTLGACLGVAAMVFYGLPEWGISHSALVLCAINLLCAGVAGWVWGGTQPAQPPVPVAQVPFEGAWVLFLLGLLGMGYQVIAIRVLSLVTENTVYSYALLLMVYLAFHASGAALYKRLHPTHSQASTWGMPVLIVAVFSGAMGLSVADTLCAWPVLHGGVSPLHALAGEALAALAALALPSAAMGYVFTQHTMHNQQTSGWLGKALFFNMLGASLAPLCLGIGIFPAWGAAGALALVLLGYTLLQRFKHFKHILKLWPLALVSVVMGGFFSWTFVSVPSGGKQLFYQQGAMASVSVVQDVNDIARLQINNRAQEGSSASSWVERRLAVLPLMLHTHPKDVLMLGLGTGFTANAAAEFKDDVQVQVVELLPEVVKASELFNRYPNMPQAKNPVQTTVADARRFVNGTRKSFDVIVADVYHPARSGAATLYTAEHFQKINDRLNDGGVFCQWLALFQMDTQTLRTIVAAYQRVYPDARAVLVSNSLDSPAVGLIARKNATWPKISALQALWRDPQTAVSAQQARLNNPFDIWGTVVADSASLRAFTQGTAPNTDDHLQVSFKAPWVTYAPKETPRDRLREVISLWHTEPPTVETPAMQARLRAYTQAHIQYLQIGMDIQANADPYVLLNAIQEQLFGLLASSPEFDPARETLSALAQAVAARHPELAQSVMSRLHAIPHFDIEQ